MLHFLDFLQFSTTGLTDLTCPCALIIKKKNERRAISIQVSFSEHRHCFLTASSKAKAYGHLERLHFTQCFFVGCCKVVLVENITIVQKDTKAQTVPLFKATTH